MTARPASLFDVESLRKLEHTTLGVLRRDDPVVVLGARQSTRDLHDVALHRDGVGIRRRHGGGGAVLLRPADRWVELWLRGAPARDHDVRSSAYLVGDWWRTALAAHGVDAVMHRGVVVDARQGAIACFAGVGPGELTVNGRKVLGISQWRVREGALVSSVLAVEDPGDLCLYLSPAAPKVPGLRGAASILSVVPGLAVDDVLTTFVEVVTTSGATIAVDEQPFS